MKRLVLLLGCLLLALRPTIAVEISGLWQGEAQGRHVVNITPTAKGSYRGEWFNLGPEAAGNPRNGNPISSVRLDGRTVKFMLDRTDGVFDGTLATDGNSISGRWQTLGPSRPLTLKRVTAKTAWPLDSSPHRMRFVTVAAGLRLEVLDWGGRGPPLIFLAGLGNTAHVFDDFAPQFTAKHHVYGITRRGIGLSSAPPPTYENYNANRLGDDVLAVIDVLKLDRPVLVGHSIAGVELSSIGTRHPEKVAGLIYLDAAYALAFYSQDSDTLNIDVNTLRRDLERLPKAGTSPSKSRDIIREIEDTIPRVEKGLTLYLGRLEGYPELPPLRQTENRLTQDAVIAGEQKYSGIKPPILAIFADPPACQPNCDSPSAKAFALMNKTQINAFERGNPTAQVVRLAHANHYLFRSNEADVVRAMKSFLGGLH